MKILGIITARGGSKGIPGKNIKPLLGKPLIEYTIDAAKKSGVFDRLILSTDDEKISEVARQLGCEVPFMRPKELSEDNTPHLPVIQHAVSYLKEKENYEPDYVMILQPTSPLRRPEHIKESVTDFEKSGADSLISVSMVPAHFHPQWQFTLSSSRELKIFTGEPISGIVKSRQELGRTYAKNGAVFLLKIRNLFNNPPSLYGNRASGYVMDDRFNVNIDDMEDWEKAEAALKKL